MILGPSQEKPEYLQPGQDGYIREGVLYLRRLPAHVVVVGFAFHWDLCSTNTQEFFCDHCGGLWEISRRVHPVYLHGWDSRHQPGLPNLTIGTLQMYHSVTCAMLELGEKKVEVAIMKNWRRWY